VIHFSVIVPLFTVFAIDCLLTCMFAIASRALYQHSLSL
jgi:hypothetical protein